MNIRNESLSLNRLGLLMKRDVLSSYRSMLIRIAAASGILLMIDILNLWGGDADLYHHIEVFSAVLLVGGFFFTSAAFKEIHRKESNMAYLLLPASPLEKVLSRILFFSAGWIVIVILWYTLFTLISFGAGELLFGTHFPMHGPFHPKLTMVYMHYMVLQSVFLAGAVYFRRTHFFKTVLALFISLFIFLLIMALFSRIIFASYFTGFFDVREAAVMQLEGLAPYRFGGFVSFMNVLKDVMYWGILAPAAWVFTYVRFREVQIKDGI